MSEDSLLFLILNELCEDEVRPPNRKVCSNEWYQNRAQLSHSKLLSELHISAPDNLKNFLRMDSKTYDELLDKARLFIEKKDTTMRIAITANERLSTTLGVLACGHSFEDLKLLTAISPQCLQFCTP